MTKPLLAAVISACLGPGAGQLYNRQWKKGIVLLSLVLLLLSGLIFFFVLAAKNTLDALMASQPEIFYQKGFEVAVAKKIIKENHGAISIFKWSFLTLWCYSIVDAFLAAQKLQKPKETTP